MKEEAVTAGFYEAEYFKPVPKIQILTIKDLLDGRAQLNYHELQDTTFKKAELKRKGEAPKKGTLFE